MPTGRLRSKASASELLELAYKGVVTSLFLAYKGVMISLKGVRDLLIELAHKGVVTSLFHYL